MSAFETGQRKKDMLAVAGAKPDLAAAARLAQDVPLNAILHSTCTATMLSGGHQENALAQLATATVQCRIMPSETPDGTRATLQKIVGPGIEVKPVAFVVSAPESPPDPKLFATVEAVAHTMWPGVPVIPSMAAGASDSIFTRNAGMPSYGISGAWQDVHDIRAHGRDERREKGAFYQSIEFDYRLMKALSTVK